VSEKVDGKQETKDAGTCPFCGRAGGILRPGDRCRYCGRLGSHRAIMGGRQPWRRTP